MGTRKQNHSTSTNAGKLREEDGHGMDLDRWRESGRVSTGDQNLDLQVDALRQAGCERIFEETVSGAKAERKQLLRLLDQVRSGVYCRFSMSCC